MLKLQLNSITSSNLSVVRKNRESQQDNRSTPRPAWDTYIPYDPEVIIKSMMKEAHRPTTALQRNVAAVRLVAEKRSLRNPKIVPGSIPASPPAKNPGPLTDSRRATSALAADAFVAPQVTASSVNTFPVPDRIANAHLYVPPHMLPIHERGAAKAAKATKATKATKARDPTPRAEHPRDTAPVPDRIANAHLYIPPHMLPIHERGAANAAKATKARDTTPCAEQPRDTVPVPNVTPKSLTDCNTLVGGNDHPLLDLEFPGEDLIWLGPPTAKSMLEEDNPVLEHDALEPTRNISLSAQMISLSTTVIAPSASFQLDGNDEQVSTWGY
jgi:hypothetical protein